MTPQATRGFALFASWACILFGSWMLAEWMFAMAVIALGIVISVNASEMPRG